MESESIFWLYVWDTAFCGTIVVFVSSWECLPQSLFEAWCGNVCPVYGDTEETGWAVIVKTGLLLGHQHRYCNHFHHWQRWWQ